MSHSVAVSGFDPICNVICKEACRDSRRTVVTIALGSKFKGAGNTKINLFQPIIDHINYMSRAQCGRIAGEVVLHIIAVAFTSRRYDVPIFKQTFRNLCRWIFFFFVSIRFQCFKSFRHSFDHSIQFIWNDNWSFIGINNFSYVFQQ